MKKILTVLLLVFSVSFYAQVGIGTTTPQETLHVEGTARITNTTTTTPTKLAGLDAAGTVTDVIVGDNLSLDGNVLNGASGPSIYLVATISIPTGPPGEEMNDFDIQVDGLHSDKVLFRLIGRTNNYKITGIVGGTDGRHIVLYNVESVNLTLDDESGLSLASNRMITLANNVATSGKGTAELIYDGTQQRWILIGFRN